MIERMKVGGLTLEVERKPIKNLHLSVLPPDGRVRIAAPLRLESESIRLFVIAKLPWVRKHREKLLAQERESPREYIDRESHYFAGKRYLLAIVPHDGPPEVSLGHDRIVLKVRSDTSESKRAEVLEAWYREHLRIEATALIRTWEPILRVKVNGLFIRRMKTKWGGCHPVTRNIRLNTELMKKPRECLEYLVVHELMHLLVPTHNARFIALMDRHLPDWRLRRDTLNRLPIGDACRV